MGQICTNRGCSNMEQRYEAGTGRPSTRTTTLASATVLAFLSVIQRESAFAPPSHSNRHRADATFKKAPRSRPAAAENLILPLLPPE